MVQEPLQSICSDDIGVIHVAEPAERPEGHCCIGISSKSSIKKLEITGDFCDPVAALLICLENFPPKLKCVEMKVY
jgi:hypothetical protein